MPPTSCCATRTTSVDRLRRANQGAYRVDPNRTTFHLPRTKGFPKNSEVETIVTFVTDGPPGDLVSQVAPTPTALTVRQHHSFVQLPELSAHTYKPRVADPRAGGIDMMFHDYASPITEPIEKHWVIRHHLQKKDPSAASATRSSPSSITWTTARPNRFAVPSSTAHAGGAKPSRPPASATATR